MARHGGIPEHTKKIMGKKKEWHLATFVVTMRNRIRKGHGSMAQHPTHLKALEGCGV